jgi:signal transduction histidine kinase
MSALKTGIKGTSGAQSKNSTRYLSVSSFLKDLIGRELVTNKYAALLELVKNSYDAGATSCVIRFQYSDPKKGEASRIDVIDDGKGMSAKDIEKKWLFVAYSEKREAPPPEEKKRTPEEVRQQEGKRMPAGRKGLGRFACDKLGKRLQLYARTEGEAAWHKLGVNWEDFETKQSKEIGEVPVELVDATPPKDLDEEANRNSGVLLLIESPRDPWPYEDLFKLKRYLQRMVNPYQAPGDFKVELRAPPSFVERDKEEERQNRIHSEDENWKPNGPVAGEIVNPVIDKLKRKSAWIKGTIERSEITTELYDKERLAFRLVESSPFPHLGDKAAAEHVETEVFFLNRDAKTEFTRIMGVRPVDYGSIYVYKNAFRVLPYGEEGDDWLGLDRRKGQGWKRTLSTRELLGRVSITDRTETFKEASGREGLHEGPALDELRKYTDEFVVQRLRRYVVEAIRWGAVESSVGPETQTRNLRFVASIAGKESKIVDIRLGKQFNELLKDRQVEAIPELVSSVQAMVREVDNVEVRSTVQGQLAVLKRGLRILSTKNKEKERALLFLEAAQARSKPVIPILNHEIGIAVESVRRQVERALRFTGGNKELARSLNEIKVSIERVARISALAAPLKSSSLSDFEGLDADLVKYITQYLTIGNKGYLDSLGLVPSFKGEDAVLVKRFDPLLVATILDNLLSNSNKKQASRILVEFMKEGRMLRVRYSDNDSGVTKEAQERMFTPGFSTTGGSGLGLYTIRYIAEEAGGHFTFLGNNLKGAEKGACFELEL